METPNPVDTLQERGLLHDHTDIEKLREHLSSGQRTFYVGYDPTASSLHVGNLVGLMAMAWLQRAGHHPVALGGGATGRVGDPSGRDEERELLDDEMINHNLAGIMADFGRVLDLSDTLVVDNYEWTREITILDFLRDIGKHFSVNQLISRESVRRRLNDREQGISYTEFSYGLLQAMDYDHLHVSHGVTIQAGGSDQWGNIVGGVDLIRRRHGERVHAFTWPLVEGSDGKKFSKSAGNAPWLDPELTSPFAYYQWWLNTDDRDVERFLRLFTFLPVDAIAAAVKEHQTDPGRRAGQKLLAAEATRVIHGDEGVEAALKATGVLFGDTAISDLDDTTLAMAFDQAPTIEVPRRELEDGIGLLEVMTRAGATKSNGEARRLVDQGAVRLNDDSVTDPTLTITPAHLATDTTLLLRVGKKRQYLLRFL